MTQPKKIKVVDLKINKEPTKESIIAAIRLVGSLSTETRPEYVVVEKFEANINNRKIICKKGDRIRLNDMEAEILKRFLI